MRIERVYVDGEFHDQVTVVAWPQVSREFMRALDVKLHTLLLLSIVSTLAVLAVGAASLVLAWRAYDLTAVAAAAAERAAVAAELAAENSRIAAVQSRQTTHVHHDQKGPK